MRPRCHGNAMTTQGERAMVDTDYRGKTTGSLSNHSPDPSGPVAPGHSGSQHIPQQSEGLRCAELPSSGGSGKFTCFLLFGQFLGLLSELIQGSESFLVPPVGSLHTNPKDLGEALHGLVPF